MTKMVLEIKIETTKSGTTAPKVTLNGKKVLAKSVSVEWEEGTEPNIEIGLGCDEMENICQN